MRSFLLATTLWVALGAATASGAAGQTEREINFAAAARAVSFCYIRRMGWTPDEAAVFSYRFLRKQGLSTEAISNSIGSAEVKELSEYMYTRLDAKCEFQRIVGGTSL